MKFLDELDAIQLETTVGQIIVGFEEETEWIIRKLTSGPTVIDVISIVGMPGLGKITLSYRVYNDKSIVDHFDVCTWCTVDQECNDKKLLQKIFNQVIGLKEKFNEDDIDDDVVDKLRKKLCGHRYLIVLDDMWDTATFDELTRPFPEFQKGSRVILTSPKKEVALHGKCHSDPLYLRLLRSEESWELLEKRVFGEERCPNELKDVGEKIARKCDGLPLILDLIGGVISRKGKKEALWLEVLNNLSYFIFKDEEEVVKDEDIWICELKDLWIGEGLVEQIDMKSAEEVVDELISSSLVYDGIKDCLSYKSHLKHLRLLKSLDLKGITFTDSLLNETGMFVHLKYLIIWTRAKALPPSFSNLCNLETLVMDNLEGSCMILSPCFWSLAKIRDVRMKCCALFDPDINEPNVLDEDLRLENLRTLYELYLPGSEDTEDIFKRFPNLQNLEVYIEQLPDCSAEKICFRRLDVLNELEQLRLSTSSWDSFHEYTHGFPSSLKKMRLQWLALTSDSLSRIGRLPNLQELSLEYAIIEVIKVLFNPQLKESTLNIKEYVEEMTGEDKLDIYFHERSYQPVKASNDEPILNTCMPSSNAVFLYPFSFIDNCLSSLNSAS
ncbi:hypothetical protein KY285_024461 [Solanum tuberosum]|nr:hypothetical protein KY285_024461 [Solanum tuberosum]